MGEKNLNLVLNNFLINFKIKRLHTAPVAINTVAKCLFYHLHELCYHGNDMACVQQQNERE